MIKGRIYAIRSPNTDKIYIGSTTIPLTKRMYYHKHKTNNCSSKEIINMMDAYIELLENYKCKDKNELHRREGELIRQYKDICINKCIAGRNHKESNKAWYDANRDKRLQKNKDWYNNNKDYYNNNKDKISQQKKDWYNNNKDKISQQQKDWYNNNKDIISQKKKTYSKTYYRAKKIQKIMNINLLPYLLKMQEFDIFFNQKIKI
jgi:hypothetical protein